MMKYLLLLILSLLTAGLISGHGIDPDGNMRDRYYSIHSDKMQPDNSCGRAQNDSINNLLGNSFIASRVDTFRIQVGAFRYKSNAERFMRKVKNLPGIKVKMYEIDGFYKIRIAQPEIAVKAEEPETSGMVLRSAANYITSSDLPPDQPMLTKRISQSGEFTPEPLFLSLLAPDTLLKQQQPENSEVLGDTSSVKSQANYSPWLKRIRYFGESYVLVNALIVTILFCIATMIALLVVILMNRRRMEREQILHQYLKEKYQSLIVDYLYGSATPEEFRAIATDNYRRQVLIDEMIDVSVNLKGEESKKLSGLYRHLGLDRDSLARARNFRWHKKIKGFRELAFMNIKSANDSMYKALNSSNEILRMEAQIALVRLSSENHFDFLSQLKRPFSLWEQITLHDLLIHHDIPVPAFNKWLKSPNDSVVLFALRMIREFKQSDAEKEIKTTLQHSSRTVRLLAVQVAGDLQLSSTLGTMKRMYKNQDYKTCLEIVRSMGKMPDKSMMGFLRLVLDKEDDVQLQIEATKSIERMGEEGVKALVKIMKSEYKNYSIIVRHVLDRRIN